MHTLRVALIALLLLLASGLVWTGVTHAQSFLSMTDSSQKLDSSLYSYGSSVNVEGTINGDVYCAGQDVTIDATVHGDVICAGQHVTVSGHIYGSLRVVAQDLTDQATVDGSFSVAAHSVVIAEEASVGGDASFIGQYFAVNGHIGRDLAARATTMNINGTVGRNVKYYGTSLNIWSKAHIKGALDYTAPASAMITKSAVIHGGVNYNQPATSTRSLRSAFASWASSFLYVFIAMLLFGLVAVLLLPQAVRAVSEEAADHPGKSLLNALAMLVLEPIIIVVLLSIIFGVPLAVVSILLFILLGFCSVPASAYYVGMQVMSRNKNAILTMTVGMFILMLLMFLPIVGLFVAVGSYFIGTGAIILALRKYLPTPVYKVK